MQIKTLSHDRVAADQSNFLLLLHFKPKKVEDSCTHDVQ